MYRTAKPNPPRCCQVSLQLTLHLAPDLKDTGYTSMSACPLRSLCKPAHIHTRTRVHTDPHLPHLYFLPLESRNIDLGGFSWTSQSCTSAQSHKRMGMRKLNACKDIYVITLQSLKYVLITVTCYYIDILTNLNCFIAGLLQ